MPFASVERRTPRAPPDRSTACAPTHASTTSAECRRTAGPDARARESRGGRVHEQRPQLDVQDERAALAPKRARRVLLQPSRATALFVGYHEGGFTAHTVRTSYAPDKSVVNRCEQRAHASSSLADSSWT